MLWCHHSLGSEQVLVFKGGALQVDHPLRPERNLQDPPDLNIHFTRTQDHHVIILQHTTNIRCSKCFLKEKRYWTDVLVCVGERRIHWESPWAGRFSGCSHTTPRVFLSELDVCCSFLQTSVFPSTDKSIPQTTHTEECINEKLHDGGHLWQMHVYAKCKYRVLHNNEWMWMIDCLGFLPPVEGAQPELHRSSPPPAAETARSVASHHRSPP